MLGVISRKYFCRIPLQSVSINNTNFNFFYAKIISSKTKILTCQIRSPGRIHFWQHLKMTTTQKLCQIKIKLLILCARKVHLNRIFVWDTEEKTSERQKSLKIDKVGTHKHTLVVERKWDRIYFDVILLQLKLNLFQNSDAPTFEIAEMSNNPN